VNQAPINLPEQVLIMIVSRVRDVRPATAEEDARSLYADVMHVIGSVSRLWRKLAKGVLMGDELASLRVPGAAAAAECMSSFPRALSLRIVGDARAGDIGAVLGSRSVMRLAIANNRMMRDCEGLGQLVGLRSWYITECGRLRDVAALSALVDLRTLRPLDTDAILASVSKTRRCVIVDEGWRSGSISAEIGMRIAETAFFELDAPLRRVCGREAPMPYAGHLEDACLPQPDAIAAAARELARPA
jgi:hypothetical protein